jgi:chloramphenicol-sensitive protein RarD
LKLWVKLIVKLLRKDDACAMFGLRPLMVRHSGSMNQTFASTAFWSALSAYSLWGLLPLFLHLFSALSPLFVTAQRIVWTLPCAFAAAVLINGLASLRVAKRTLLLLALSALLIGGNWLLYVWAVGQNRVVESSLGYFINPLINVAMGVAFFREKLTKWQVLAIVCACAGVLNQTFLVGAFPYVALGLAFSFAAYGLVRKLAQVEPAAGLFWESVILVLPAVFVLGWYHQSGEAVMGGSLQMAGLLFLLGPATAIPLILFAIGARGLPFTILGLLQYLAPTLQFTTGILMGETFTAGHGVTFALIWAGLGVYSIATIKAYQNQKPVAPTL